MSTQNTRFAIYTRYSSDMQNEMSLEAQEDCCQRAVTERGGVVVDVFSDSAKSGWSLDREGFNALRRAAEKGAFDAIMFWKFDRLARDYNHILMIKLLLRHEYGIKLYCVEGFSEDDDDSPDSAIMEQMLAVFSAFYSHNLSTETKRGKRQRALKGEFNGSVAPLGYDLVTQQQATEERPQNLYINSELAPIVLCAFELYSTGEYSDSTLAQWFNKHEIIQGLRSGKKPIGKDTVRDLLQNQVYTGKVPYAETHYSESLGKGKQSSRKRKEWYEGNHQAIVSEELFDKCQLIRQQKSHSRQRNSSVRTFILSDRVYCARCLAAKPPNLEDANYGKMRAKWDIHQEDGYYSCVAVERGHTKCGQLGILISSVDSQVVHTLKHLHIPDEYHERVKHAVQEKSENDEALKRMSDLLKIIKRMDLSMEQGYAQQSEYLEQRTALQNEMEILEPTTYSDLTDAADLLENFATYWDNCSQKENLQEARYQLTSKIVKRVLVYDKEVLGIILLGDYIVRVNVDISLPASIRDLLV